MKMTRLDVVPNLGQLRLEGRLRAIGVGRVVGRKPVSLPRAFKMTLDIFGVNPSHELVECAVRIG